MKARIASFFAALALLAPAARAVTSQKIVVSVPDQKLVVFDGDKKVASYPVSTSKFGLGDQNGSYRTPLGELEVASRIGANAPVGAVFKGRVPTGEVLRPNAPGRDPIVTRIIQLRGCESQNAGALDRGIYIHGTPVERQIGRPASYGCIRMRSRDVVQLFDTVTIGTKINIVNKPLSQALRK
jgi:lipoprotein-anchoring transpeptidase ErfK/SrfK